LTISKKWRGKGQHAKILLAKGGLKRKGYQEDKRCTRTLLGGAADARRWMSRGKLAWEERKLTQSLILNVNVKLCLETMLSQKIQNED